MWLDWLFQMPYRDDAEIVDHIRAIEERDRSIEAITPIAEEAIRRTDDAFYELRAKVRAAARRMEYADSVLFLRAIREVKEEDDLADDHNAEVKRHE